MLNTWMNAYLRAWDSNDPADIAALFTEDALYFTAPYDPPWVGREEIVAGWISIEDARGTFEFEWEPVSVAGEVQVVRGTARYPTTTYSNLWVLRLTDDGRCREFTEYWMEHPRRRHG